MSEQEILKANEDKEVDLENRKWKNRRQMAWIALWAILIVTGLAFTALPLERLERLSNVIEWFYMCMASIVGAYFGFATYASRK